MKTSELKKLYLSHKGTCCKCGCTLEDDIGEGLGSIFVLDKDGRFYCMDHDGEFEDGDERIFEIDLCDDESDEDETAETKEMIYHACYGDERITSIIVSSYCYCPGEIAIELNWRGESDGAEEYFSTLTVCLGEDRRFSEPGFAYVDTNNMPGAEQFIKENGLGEPTGAWTRSGFCTYPLYKFNIDELKKHVRPEYMDEFEKYLKQFKKEEDA